MIKCDQVTANIYIYSKHSSSEVNKSLRQEKNMGVQGTLEYLSDMISSAKKGKKKKQFNTVNLKVTRIDCEGCAMKIKKALSGLKGIVFFSFLFVFSFQSTHFQHSFFTGAFTFILVLNF